MSALAMLAALRRAMRWLLPILTATGGLLSAHPVVAGVARQVVAPNGMASRLLYHPYLPKHATGEQSTVEIFNFGLESAEVVAQFYDGLGVPVQTVTGTLAALELYPLDLALLNDLPDGDYALILEATGPLYSLVRVMTPKRLGSSIGGLGLYPGQAQATFDLAFAPVTGGTQGSELVLMNRTNAPATVNLDYHDGTANPPITATVEIAPFGSVQLPPAELPADFSGLVTARANRALVGLLVQHHFDDRIEFIPAQEAHSLAVRSATVTNIQYPLPRLLRKLDLGGGPRSSTTLVSYAGAGMALGNLTYHTATGWPAGSESTFAIAGKTSLGFASDGLPDPIVSAVVGGEQPLVVADQTDYIASSPYATASYGATGPLSCDHRLPLPLVADQATRYSVIYVQNIDGDAAELTITLRDRRGAVQATVAYELPAGGMHFFDLRQVADLPDEFVGSAEILTPYRLLCAQVDEFVVGHAATVVEANLTTQAYLPAIFGK